MALAIVGEEWAVVSPPGSGCLVALPRTSWLPFGPDMDTNDPSNIPSGGSVLATGLGGNVLFVTFVEDRRVAGGGASCPSGWILAGGHLTPSGLVVLSVTQEPETGQLSCEIVARVAAKGPLNCAAGVVDGDLNPDIGGRTAGETGVDTLSVFFAGHDGAVTRARVSFRIPEQGESRVEALGVQSESFRGHSDHVRALSIAGGAKVITASDDGSVRVWTTGNRPSKSAWAIETSTSISPPLASFLSVSAGVRGCLVAGDTSGRLWIWNEGADKKRKGDRRDGDVGGGDYLTLTGASSHFHERLCAQLLGPVRNVVHLGGEPGGDLVLACSTSLGTVCIVTEGGAGEPANVREIQFGHSVADGSITAFSPPLPETHTAVRIESLCAAVPIDVKGERVHPIVGDVLATVCEREAANTGQATQEGSQDTLTGIHVLRIETAGFHKQQ